MRLTSFVKDGTASFGGVTGDRLVDLSPRFSGRFGDLKSLIAGGGLTDLPHSFEPESGGLPVQNARFLPVIPNPGKIFCIGVNYADHQKEMGRGKTAHPTAFLRFPDTLVAHGEGAWAPKVSTAVDYECELAVIIGKGGRYIEADKAMDHVAGYTCFNDISIRDWQQHTHSSSPARTSRARARSDRGW